MALLVVCFGVCVVSSLLVVSVVVLILWVCTVRVFISCSCMLSSLSGWVRSRRGRRVGVGEFVNVPFPKFFVHCDMEPVAEFSVWVLSSFSYSFSSDFAFGAEGFGCFFW